MRRAPFRFLAVTLIAAGMTASVAFAQPPSGRGSLPAVQIGPSAPVPPEVAMLRPSPTELQQINDALRDPSIKTRLAELGVGPGGGSAGDFGAFIAAETEKWAKVVKFAGTKAN